MSNSLKGAVITVGDELLSGAQIDTNGPFLAETLRGRGIEVRRLMSVGDDEEAIGQALRQSMDQATIVIVTGGLGPTSDDITAAAIGRAVNRPLALHEEALERMRALLKSYKLAVTENQKKQVYLPEGAEMIPNRTGTAPGFMLRESGRFIAVMPGVPGELRVMMEEEVVPRLEEVWQDRPCFRTRTLKLFGLSEAKVDELVHDFVDHEEVKIAFLPHFPEVCVSMTVQAADRLLCEERLSVWEKTLRGRLDPYVFGVDDDTMEAIVGTLLKKHEATIAIAESCTGGLIGHRITSVPGSSDYLDRVVVTYSNVSKIDLLKVPEEVIATHGAVSEPTARHMAEGIRAIAGTTLGIATTGVAGPGGGTPDKPVGTVFVALADEHDVWVKRYLFPGDRSQIKILTAQVALNQVRRYLSKESADKNGGFELFQ